VARSQLLRVRWAVRLSLVLGVAASVCANVLHANQNPIAQTIAAWPPLALLLTVELISRVPIHRRDLAAVRLLATAAIAGIAAWVSYWHMMGVAARYGETGTVPYLLPLSVDGLIIVASVSLVELGSRIREIEAAALEPVTLQAAASAPAAASVPAAFVPAASVPAASLPAVAVTAAASPGATPAPTPGPVAYEATVELPLVRASRGSAGQGAERKRPTSGSRTATGRAAVPPAKRRPVAETRALVAKLTADDPAASHDDLARQLGITTRRLRTVLADANT
jgi:hypothetical protein